jgi:hypothetical protein
VKCAGCIEEKRRFPVEKKYKKENRAGCIQEKRPLPVDKMAEEDEEKIKKKHKMETRARTN